VGGGGSGGLCGWVCWGVGGGCVLGVGGGGGGGGCRTGELSERLLIPADDCRETLITVSV